MLIMLTSAAAGSSATTQWLPSSHQSDFVAMADAYAQAVSSLREQAERATDSLMKNGFSIKNRVVRFVQEVYCGAAEGTLSS